MKSPVLGIDDRLQSLFEITRNKIFAASGEWVNWQDLRPAHRSRETYDDLLWLRVLGDPEFEVEEKQHGIRVRRRVRLFPT